MKKWRNAVTNTFIVEWWEFQWINEYTYGDLRMSYDQLTVGERMNEW
jgi:hypothetical protein